MCEINILPDVKKGNLMKCYIQVNDYTRHKVIFEMAFQC